MDREFKLLEALRNLVRASDRCGLEGTDIRQSFAFKTAKDVIESVEVEHHHLLRDLKRRIREIPDFDPSPGELIEFEPSEDLFNDPSQGPGPG